MNQPLVVALVIASITLFSPIGHHGSAHSKDRLPKHRSGEMHIVFDPASFELRLHNSQTGAILLRSVAVGGSLRCHNRFGSCKTPAGEYRIQEKRGGNYRSHSYPVSCKNASVCGAAMPYYLKFSGKDFGIHGGFVPREPLAHISHACIRIPLEKARQLDSIVPLGTRAYVLPY